MVADQGIVKTPSSATVNWSCKYLPWIVLVPGPHGNLILVCVPFHAFFRGVVIEKPISFDDVQSRGVWRAKPVDHGKGPDLEPHCVYYQRVPFIVAHGIPVPGWRYLGGMRLVHAHMADLMIIVIKESDLVRAAAAAAFHRS